MSIEENKAIVRSFIEGLRHDLAAIDELCTLNFTAHLPGFPGPADRDTFKNFASMFYNALPDLQHTVEAQIAENNMVVSRVTVRGTHQGPFQGIRPTGKQVEITDIIIMRLENGRAVELWAQFDVLGLLQQLGVTILRESP
ncbi:MAG: ester cyclase [Candidatus Hydrogenedentota bacterium]|nr:MAG: ester cyclase [Candidatus Hydrogenedentota bacterium]